MNQTVLTGNSADLSCVVPSVPYNVVVQWYNGNVVVQADSTSKINTQHTSSYKVSYQGVCSVCVMCVCGVCVCVCNVCVWCVCVCSVCSV